MVFQEIALDHWRGSRGAENITSIYVKYCHWEFQRWQPATYDSWYSFLCMLQSPFVLEITKGWDIFARPTISSWIMGWVRISCPLWSWHPLAWKKWNSPSICRKIWGWMCGTPDRWVGQTGNWQLERKNDGKTTYQFAWMFEKSWKKMGSLYRWFSMFLAFIVCIKDVFYCWTLRGESVWSKRGQDLEGIFWTVDQGGSAHR